MTERVNIQDAAALDRFAAHLTNYETSVQAVRHGVNGEIERTLNYLGERYRLWKRRFEAYRDEADRLWSKLEACSDERLDRRDRNATIPRACTSILEQYLEACRIRDDAKAKMDLCSALIGNVESARDAFRDQAMQVEQRLGETANASRKTLAARAARARELEAHRYSGPALVHPGAIGVDMSEASVLGGTEAAPTARWGAGYAGPAAPPPESAGAGAHETDGRDGPSKEPTPDPEGAEGPVRLNEPPLADLNPPAEWLRGKERA